MQPNIVKRIFTDKSNYTTQQTVERLSFIPVRTTFVDKVTLTEIDKSTFFEAYNSIASKGYKIHNINDTTTQEILDLITKAHLEYYQSTHQIISIFGSETL